VPFDGALLPTLFEALAKIADPPRDAQLLLVKLLKAAPPRLTKSVTERLRACADIIVLLEYIEAIDFGQAAHSAERRLLRALRDDLVRATGLAFDREFVVTGVPPRLLGSPLFERVAACLTGNLEPASLPVPSHESLDALRVLASSSLVKTRPGAMVEAVAACLAVGHDAQTEPIVNSLPFRQFALPVAQSLLRALVHCGECQRGSTLLDAMEPVLLEDAMPLHWVRAFVVREFSRLDAQIRARLAALVCKLPFAGDWFVPQCTDQIKTLVAFVQVRDIHRKMTVGKTFPEYSSVWEHIKAFFEVSVLVRNDGVDRIVADLVRPFEPGSFVVVKKPKVCAALAEIYGELPMAITYPLFREMLKRPLDGLVLDSAARFLLLSPLSTVQRVCHECRDLIGDRIPRFVRMVMPGVLRLDDHDEVVIGLLEALLQAVKPTTPIAVQEEVIDVVGFVWATVADPGTAERLKQAAAGFAPALKLRVSVSFTSVPDMGTARLLVENRV
jgi:hypothetical protein